MIIEIEVLPSCMEKLLYNISIIVAYVNRDFLLKILRIVLK